MRRAPIVVVIAAAGAACASLDGLTAGGAPDDTGTDTSIPAVDSGDGGVAPIEAGADSSITDGGTDAPPFCSTHPAVDASEIWFCDDFERPGLIGPWDSLKLTTGATLALDVTEATSPIYSLRVDIQPDASAEPSAYLRKTFAKASAVRLSYDIRVHAAIAQTFGVFGQFTTAAPAPSLEKIFHRLLIFANAAAFESVHVPPDGGAGVHTQHPLSRPLAQDVWEHVTLDVTLGATSTAQMHLGSEEVLPVTPIDSFAGTLELNGGAYYVTTRTEQWTVFVDNVLLEAFP
jgi:hypothetical protein